MRTTIPWRPGALAILFALTVAPVFAAQIYTTALTISAEDLIATPEGRKVKELNKLMRESAAAAEKLKKGSRSYQILKRDFDDLKRRRDEIGEPLRGLRNKEIVFYGDRANTDAYSFKRQFIDKWRTDPRFRQANAGGSVHVSYDKTGRLRVAGTAPRAEDVDSYRPEPQQAQPRPSAPDQTGTVVVTTPDDANAPNMGCVGIMGMGSTSPECQ